MEELWQCELLCGWFCVNLHGKTSFYCFLVMIRSLIFVGAGSCLGGVARYLLTKLVQVNVGGTFPWGTMLVNVVGCLLIGLLYGVFERNCVLSDGERLFLTVGFCGGFTTFSTFVHESYALLGERNFMLFVAYSMLSFGVGLLCVHLGHLLVKAV